MNYRKTIEIVILKLIILNLLLFFFKINFIAAQPADSFRFVVTADSRCAPDANTCTDDSGVNVEVFNRVLESIRNHDPAFVVFSGDMVFGKDIAPSVDVQLNAWKVLMEGKGFSLNKTMPVWGGHERDLFANGVWTAWQSVFDPAGTNPSKYFDPEDNGPNCHYPDASYGDFGRTVYYCDYENARFFVLNNDIICDDPEDETTCVKHTLGRTRSIAVISANDDAEENVQTGAMSLTSSDLELVRDGQNQQYVGIRFAEINIPQGAVIQSAYIQFQADDDESPGSGAADLTIRGQDVDDATTFGSSNSDISYRVTTSASVAWSPLAWEQEKEAGVAQQTPDLSTIIQEIVNRNGWEQGNALAIIISRSGGSGTRVAESYDGDPNGAAVLYVDYKDQLGWIEDHLVDNGKQLNFFFHHEPAYGTGAHKVGDKPLAMDQKPEKRNKYIELLGDNSAKTMIFSGHEHQYTRRLITEIFANLPINNPGGQAVYFPGSFYEIKTGTCGAPIYNDFMPLYTQPDYVFGPEYEYHFAVVDVFNETVSVKVHTDDGAMIDSFFYGTDLFEDVAPGSNHEKSIYAIFYAGITTGCSQDPWQFCPQDPVTRAQMAAFIIRALEGEPPDNLCPPSPFPDVDPNLRVCKYIKRLSELEITTGYPDGTYRPYNNVTRAQMATFIVRAKEGEPSDNYCDTGSPFPDVPPNSPTCKYIKRFFELGITTGYPDGTYRPSNNVIRRQMAAFLDRAFLDMD